MHEVAEAERGGVARGTAMMKYQNSDWLLRWRGDLLSGGTLVQVGVPRRLAPVSEVGRQRWDSQPRY